MAADGQITSTPRLVAALKSQQRCEVESGPAPAFTYVDREIVAGRGLVDGKPAFQTDTRLALDVLAVTDDGVPVVVELKVEGDQNAKYGLIQALASAAQLAPAVQRRRLPEAYPQVFPDVPQQLDVSVVRFRPNAASRPREALADQARALLRDLRANHAAEGWVLHPWVRRIHLFTADRIDGKV